MNWIKSFWQLFFVKSKSHRGDNQQRLVLLVCIPCFLITIIALFLAQISGYLIAFILIVLFLLCTYVVVASKQDSEYQIRTLSNLIESMIDGDYTLRGRLQTNQAFQELLDLINNLASTLSKHKIEAKESKLLLERIMEQMDAMVIATDELGYIVMANASANKLILGDLDHLSDIKLSTLPIGTEIVNANTGIVEFERGDLNQGKIKGEHFLFKESFLSEGKKHQLYMLTNAERLLMEKERKAWQSLLRVLSHEMNNSLTPIISISQSMQKKLQQSKIDLTKESLLEGTSIINERADSLSQFISSYSQLSHLPEPNRKPFDLASMINTLSALYPTCNINCLFDQKVIVEADKNQFEQILINLFKNALEAMNMNQDKTINIVCEEKGSWQHIIICDYGTGIANLDNVFVPFYTTKNHGSGIGLALCRQIMFNHNGLIDIENAKEHSGVDVTLSLPK